MQQKQISFYILTIATVVLLTSCGTGNKFASSFGKRKYMHGYYFDMPGPANLSAIPCISSSGQYKDINNYKYGAIKNTELRNKPLKKQEINNFTLPEFTSITRIKIRNKYNPLKNQLIANSYQPISNSRNPVDTDSFVNTKKDINYFSIAGCSFSVAGVGLILIESTTVIAALTTAAIILLSLGIVFGIIGLFIPKYYLNWLAVVGFGFIVALFILVLL